MAEEQSGEKWIRVVQGHSIKLVDDDQLLVQLHLNDIDNFSNFPDKCVHGAFYRHWPSIKERGLVAGGTEHAIYRNHIHFFP